MNTTATDSRRRLPGHAARPVRPAPVAWWTWPHLWSLDAPLVAVVWQHWWAHVARVNLPWSRDLILGMAVWLIYLADRLADVSRGGATGWTEHGTARHAFYARSRGVTAVLVLAVALALAVATSVLLPTEEFAAGLTMLALAGTYFWLTHRRATPCWTATVPKEAAVGGLFALGTVLFVAGHAEWVDGWLLVAGLAGAALFAVNCALISRWEACARDRRDPASLQNAFPGVTARLGGVCLVLAVVATGGAFFARSDVFLPIAVSAGCLAALDFGRNRISTDALRVLADVALLTPWCFLLRLG